ncbi:MAG: TIGR04013 family B12-binding domain/radical SAM domain-containing protein [Candidatus Ozemobacteraceae bacterium]
MTVFPSRKMLKYQRMNAESSSPIRPVLLVRLHNYNRVSFGALLGACSNELLAQFDVKIWESTAPLPHGLFLSPALFLYSFMFTHAQHVQDELRHLRYRASQSSAAPSFFLAGGSQATSAPASVLAMGFDSVIAGEAENAFPAFLQAWLDGRPSRGITSIEPGQVNLDDFPGFHPLIEYLPPIEISRGCTFGCAYCAVPRLQRGTLRHRSIESIASIIRAYLHIKPHRIRIKFLCPNSFAYGSPDGRKPNLGALHALLSRLKEEGVPEISFGSFPSEVRPDFVTPEVLDVVVPFLSNRVIVMGVQSGDDKRLAAMCRGHTRDQAVTAIRLLRERGFTPHVDFIIGLPGENEFDQNALLDFMEEMIKTYAIRVHMHTFMPLPATPWADRPCEPICIPARDRLRALAARGILDGWWENQIAYGRKKT